MKGALEKILGKYQKLDLPKATIWRLFQLSIVRKIVYKSTCLAITSVDRIGSVFADKSYELFPGEKF